MNEKKDINSLLKSDLEMEEVDLEEWIDKNSRISVVAEYFETGGGTCLCGLQMGKRGVLLSRRLCLIKKLLFDLQVELK